MPEDLNSSSSESDNLPLAVNSLSYAYPGSLPVISDFTLNLPRGSRCLLLGANGAGNFGSAARLPSLIYHDSRATRYQMWTCAPGKSTLLQVLAGQHMVAPDVVRILGRPAFHDVVSLCHAFCLQVCFIARVNVPVFLYWQQLTSSGDLSYLGAQWRRDVAFAGYNIALQVYMYSSVCFSALSMCTAVTLQICMHAILTGNKVISPQLLQMVGMLE